MSSCVNRHGPREAANVNKLSLFSDKRVGALDYVRFRLQFSKLHELHVDCVGLWPTARLGEMCHRGNCAVSGLVPAAKHCLVHRQCVSVSSSVLYECPRVILSLNLTQLFRSSGQPHSCTWGVTSILRPLSLTESSYIQAVCVRIILFNTGLL